MAQLVAWLILISITISSHVVLGFSQFSPDKLTRGARYESNNSTIPTAAQAANTVGVRPPLDASAATWKRAWKIHRAAMPLLHFRDPLQPPDSCLSLMCLWWKALSGMDRKSPVYDLGLHYRLLPKRSRFILKLGRPFFPRLHHANVEIRTAYLDGAISQLVETHKTKKKIRLITLGGGYDLRSFKFRDSIQERIELDLPQVVDSKRRLLKERLLPASLTSSSPWQFQQEDLPTCYKVDLNDLTRVEEVLGEIMSARDKDEDWHTIVVVEAVMIYLDEGVPTNLLRLVRRHCGGACTLCFADRLENIPGGDAEIGTNVLRELGWKVVDWQPKPGLARHMGVAEPSNAEI